MNTTNFSNETLNATVAAMNSIDSEIHQIREQIKNGSYVEVAQLYLMDKFEMTQSEAEEVCSQIQNGINEFDAQYQENAGNDKVNLRSKLEEVTLDMDADKRIEYLSSVLAAFQAADIQAATPDQIDGLKSQNASKSPEELIAEIENLFNEKISVEKLTEFVNSAADSDAIIALSHEIATGKEEYRFLTALFLYVQQSEGKIKLSETDSLPANMLGSLACAAIELMSTTGDLKSGKIDMKRWQKVVKWILGAIVGCALAYVALQVILLTAGTIVGFIFELFGMGLLALIAAHVVSFFVCRKMFDCSSEIYHKILTTLSSVFDQYIDPISAKIKGIVMAIKNWFAINTEAEKGQLDEKQDITEETSVNMPSGVVTA